MPEQTTMIEQYRRIKERYKDAILFFRLGDFYEMFNEDALEASTLLDLTLTRRQNQPMCGIPYHAAKSYIARLLKSGRKVAICEQTAVPGRRGLMDREVVEVITPGTAIEDDFLEHGANNYLMSVCMLEGRCCIAYMDVSTGEFRAHASDEKENASEWFRSELFRIAPREILVQQSLLEQPSIGQAVRECAAVVQAHPDWMFDIAHAADVLQRHFGVASLRGFGFDRNDPEIAAAGVLLEYAEDMLRQPCIHIRSLLRHDDGAYVSLDEATRKNLELVRNLTDATRRDTLLAVLDLTRTAGGARLMRRWMLQPLRKKAAIESRLEGVSFFYHHQLEMAETRKLLGSVLDMERLLSRLAMNKAHAKDLKALGNSLEASLSLFAYLKDCNAAGSGIRMLSDDLREEIASVAALLARAILDEPSILLNEGNMIRNGYNPELDRLRALHQDTQGVLERYLEEEKNNTGIQNLRIRYNRVIGYYLEVTRGKLDQVPEHFIRRQSLVGGERYTTEKLAELEHQIESAQDRIIELERKLFLAIREEVQRSLASMTECAALVAEIDCLASLAQAATANGYVRPSIVEEPILDIQNGRHPVVEQCMPYGAFVPNTLSLGADAAWFALITGPNMAGKSTVLRQTALIVLMAHMGSYVPAESATIGLVDKIFCRVGAQDNLARGESTFLVEMHETAFILNTASSRSLVIMDEVGRGTGTLDGVAIAWAVTEYLLENIRCRTLFATHYHELTGIEHPGLRNMRMAVIEREGMISFPKRLESGISSGSYGIHVARLAGLPQEVIAQAAALEHRLRSLERGLAVIHSAANEASNEPSRSDSRHAMAKNEEKHTERSLSLFSQEDLVIARLKGIDPLKTTPLEAIQILSELAAMLKQ